MLKTLTLTPILITCIFFKKKNNLLQTQLIPSDIKNGLKQLIGVPAQATLPV